MRVYREKRVNDIKGAYSYMSVVFSHIVFGCIGSLNSNVIHFTHAVRVEYEETGRMRKEALNRQQNTQNEANGLCDAALCSVPLIL